MKYYKKRNKINLLFGGNNPSVGMSYFNTRNTHKQKRGPYLKYLINNESFQPKHRTVIKCISPKDIKNFNHIYSTNYKNKSEYIVKTIKHLNVLNKDGVKQNVKHNIYKYLITYTDDLIQKIHLTSNIFSKSNLENHLYMARSTLNYHRYDKNYRDTYNEIKKDPIVEPYSLQNLNTGAHVTFDKKNSSVNMDNLDCLMDDIISVKTLYNNKATRKQLFFNDNDLKMKDKLNEISIHSGLKQFVKIFIEKGKL